MSIDLLERLISDIISVTQELIDSAVSKEEFYLPCLSSLEKEYSSKASSYQHHGEHPMIDGVHKSVC
jgi:glutamate decarboxylase